MISNPLGNSFNYVVEGKEGINIKNNNIKKIGRSSNRQSAGVCEETLQDNSTAPQRIHAKDL